MAEKTISIADKPTLDEVKALLENSGYGLSALKSLLSAGSGAVKSVQRGVYTWTNHIWTKGIRPSCYVSIATVNPKKTVTFATGAFNYIGSENTVAIETNVSSSGTTVTLSPITKHNAECDIIISWQVIEFY